MNKDQARQNLIHSLKCYIQTVYNESESEYCERLIVGVLSFIAVNYFKDPYLPINIYHVIEESNKKWWEFWK